MATAAQLTAAISVTGAESAKSSFSSVSNSATNTQNVFSAFKPFNMGRAISDTDVAAAKLQLIESDVNKARQKLQSLQSAADAGKAVTGIPEAQANLTLLEAKAQEAREDLQKLGTQSKETSQDMNGIGTAADDAAESLNGGFLSGLRTGISNLVDFGSKVGQTIFGLENLYSGFKGLVSGLFSSDAAMEQTDTAFTQLLGSSKAAHAELQSLQQFAAQTPFEFPELALATQKLIAFQIPLAQTKPLLTAIGDALSGLGENTPATLEQVVDVFGQMNAAGKIQTQDLMQLTSVGINGFQILADQMHKPVSVIKQMVTDGVIPASQGIQMLQAGMEKTFGGGMAAQATTFNGLLSTLQDNIGSAWRAFTGPLFDKAKTGLEDIGNLVSSKAFQDFAGSLGKGVASVFSDIAGAFGRVASYFGSFDMTSVTHAFSQLGDAVGRILSPLQSLGSNKQASAFFTGLKNDLSQALVKAIHDVADFIGGLANALNGLGKNKDVTGFLGSLETGFKSVSSIVGGTLSANFKTFSQTAQSLGKWWQTTMGPAIQSAMPGFEHLASVVATNVVPALAQIWSQGQKLMRDVMPPLTKAFETISPIVVKVGGFLADNLGQALKFIMPFAVQAAQQLEQFGSAIITRVTPFVEKMYTSIKTFLDWIKPYWPSIWNTIKTVLTATWDTIKGVIQIAWAIVSGIIKVGLDLLSGNWKGAWNDIKSMFSGIWDGIKSIAQGVWALVSKPITDGINNFKTGWSNAWNGIKTTFSNIWDGIKNAASGAWNGITGAIKGGINDVINAINSFINMLDRIQIHIPSVGVGPVKTPSFDWNGLGIPDIPRLAIGGTIARGGMAFVGEQGPEPVWLPAGAQVFPHSQMQSAMAGYQGTAPGTPIILQMDGRIVARGLMPHIVGEVRMRTAVNF